MCCPGYHLDAVLDGDIDSDLGGILLSVLVFMHSGRSMCFYGFILDDLGEAKLDGECRQWTNLTYDVVLFLIRLVHSSPFRFISFFFSTFTDGDGL